MSLFQDQRLSSRIEISSISYSTTCAKDWDDIVTTHSEESFARLSGKRLGKYNFGFAVDQTAKPKSKDTSFGIAKVNFRPFFLSLYLQDVCVTACGNFAIVGSHRNFEAVQTMQNLFLKVYGDILIVHAEMREDLERLALAQQKESQRVFELLGLLAHHLCNCVAVNQRLIRTTFLTY